MRLLLDTRIALWAITDDRRLAAAARDLILDPEHVVVVSAANVWEIAIKHALAKVDMPVAGSQAMSFFREAGYELLPISAQHAAAVEALPPLHRDPFDRIIVAQALHEPMRLVTHDAAVKAYSDSILLV